MLSPSSNQGYHIFLKEPLSANNDFKGRKIRGTQSYHGVIRLLGGSPVVLPKLRPLGIVSGPSGDVSSHTTVISTVSVGSSKSSVLCIAA